MNLPICHRISDENRQIIFNLYFECKPEPDNLPWMQIDVWFPQTHVLPPIVANKRCIYTQTLINYPNLDLTRENKSINFNK